MSSSSSRKKRPSFLYALTCAAVVAADQAVKAWTVANIPLNASPAEELPLIPGLVHLTYIRNTGSAFGMFKGARWAFLVLLAAFCAMVVWAVAKEKLRPGWEQWLAVLTVGGALGNGIDRLLYGYVVDMFELEFMRFPVFNVADSFICVACCLFVILTLTDRSGSQEPAE